MRMPSAWQPAQSRITSKAESRYSFREVFCAKSFNNALVKSRSGVSDATIESAFPIDDAQLPQVVAALEKRFGRKLNASVVVDPELIGGIRVAVGDEVLDTSVRARLERMRLALVA